MCLQGGDYKRPEPTNTPCACTKADVECDYGYVVAEDGNCKALQAVSVLVHLLLRCSKAVLLSHTLPGTTHADKAETTAQAQQTPCCWLRTQPRPPACLRRFVLWTPQSVTNRQ